MMLMAFSRKAALQDMFLSAAGLRATLHARAAIRCLLAGIQAHITSPARLARTWSGFRHPTCQPGTAAYAGRQDTDQDDMYCIADDINFHGFTPVSISVKLAGE
jgi:hypothetical protein